VIRPPRSCAILVQVLLLGAAAPTVAAQAVMVGIVRDDSTGAPIPGVEVLLNGTQHVTTTNSQGRYALAGIPAGAYQTFFRLVGHLPVRLDVRLTDGDTTRASTTMIRSDVVLAPIVVTGAPSTRGVGLGRDAFDERKRLGFGRFLDSTELRRLEGTLNLDDVLRRYTGIEVAAANKFMRVALHPSRRDVEGRLNCLMQLYYNGAPVGRGGVIGTSDVKAEDLRGYSVAGIERVEVYRSAAEVPLEYGGSSAGCGVILLWSRLSP
jgi:hypothetical protein